MSPGRKKPNDGSGSAPPGASGGTASGAGTRRVKAKTDDHTRMRAASAKFMLRNGATLEEVLDVYGVTQADLDALPASWEY